MTFTAFSGGNDAEYPQTSLLALSGLLYGTTRSGGFYGTGTVYSVDPTSGAESVLQSFSDFPDGANPDGALVAYHNTLWGPTLYGGSYGNQVASGGTVYSLDLGSGIEQVDYSFDSAQYQYNSPGSALTFYKNGFYGTTTAGGAHGLGSIFIVLKQ